MATAAMRMALPSSPWGGGLWGFARAIPDPSPGTGREGLHVALALRRLIGSDKAVCPKGTHLPARLLPRLLR